MKSNRPAWRVWERGETLVEAASLHQTESQVLGQLTGSRQDAAAQMPSAGVAFFSHAVKCVSIPEGLEKIDNLLRIAEMTHNVPLLSGDVWNYPAARRAQIVRRVCEALEAQYGRPRLGNPEDSLDDLVFIVLSNKTSSRTSLSIYQQLKMVFLSWNELAAASLQKIKRVLKPGGLSDIKARQLRSALRKVERDFGTCSLKVLRKWSESQVEAYLTSLPGISDKVAKCVMLYTMNFDVLPIDAHVHRVSARLGWTARKRADQCHSELEALVKPKYRYAFHVDCIVHGRQVCRPVNPQCEVCIIRRSCSYYLERDERTTTATDCN